jgi:hypothetical protein
MGYATLGALQNALEASRRARLFVFAVLNPQRIEFIHALGTLADVGSNRSLARWAP